MDESLAGLGRAKDSIVDRVASMKAAEIGSLVGLDASGIPGRDLTLSPPDELPGVFGMSGEYGETPEMRTDGREVVATAPRFYAVVGDHLWAGDAKSLREDDRADRDFLHFGIHSGVQAS